LDELIKHALKALKGTTGDNISLTSSNTSISVVGKDMKYTSYSNNEIKDFLSSLDEDKKEDKEDKMDEEKIEIKDNDKN
jgi:20S proteasome alpha/beta subunit